MILGGKGGLRERSRTKRGSGWETKGRQGRGKGTEKPKTPKRPKTQNKDPKVAKTPENKRPARKGQGNREAKNPKTKSSKQTRPETQKWLRPLKTPKIPALKHSITLKSNTPARRQRPRIASELAPGTSRPGWALIYLKSGIFKVDSNKSNV